ncbi:MAG: hypothetical protein WC738_03205 [Candidatus Omnitrophota bacterium]|jgi:hypothetical protein
MNKKLVIVIGIIVAIVAFGFIKDAIVKISVEKGVEIVTGLKLSIRNFNVGILRTAVNIGGLKLYNPTGFKDRVMLDMPQIYVHYDLPAIFGGTVHLSDVRIDMEEFTVVKNEKGELNLNSLKVAQAGKKGEAKKPEKRVSAGKAPNVKIDSLRLKIGKAVYKDYSKGGAPDVKEFNINIDETYTNIDNPSALVSLIVVKALANTSIAGMANFDIGSMKSSVSDTLAGAQQAAARATTAAKESVAKTQETVKETADKLKNVFNNPFGGK